MGSGQNVSTRNMNALVVEDDIMKQHNHNPNANAYLHLEHIRAALDGEHEVLQHVAFVQSEATGEVGYGRVQQQRRQQVGPSAGQHALEIPPGHLG